MTRADAVREAKEAAAKHGMGIVVVKEGLHADEFAERDADGESYGFCPVGARPTLYKYAEWVEAYFP